MKKRTAAAKIRSRRIWMKIGISGVVLAMAAIIIMSRMYPDDYVKWAFGTVGLVFGYWCR